MDFATELKKSTAQAVEINRLMNMNHVQKYYWTIDHEKIGVKHAQGTIELCPQLVNPVNNEISKHNKLNTKFQWWVEFSKLDSMDDEHNTHYQNLDCGGDTAEEAINALYELVLKEYGTY